MEKRGGRSRMMRSSGRGHRDMDESGAEGVRVEVKWRYEERNGEGVDRDE